VDNLSNNSGYSLMLRTVFVGNFSQSDAILVHSCNFILAEIRLDNTYFKTTYNVLYRALARTIVVR